MRPKSCKNNRQAIRPGDQPSLYRLHHTKGYKRLRQWDRVAIQIGEAKFNWFLQQGKKAHD